MTRIWDRIKAVGHWARGDGLTPLGKAKLLTYSIVALFVATASFALAEFWSAAYACAIVAYPLLLSFFIYRWLAFVPPSQRGCDGAKNQFTSPSGELAVVVCHGCEAWGVIVRDEDKGQGKGVESLMERMKELVVTHQTNVPALAKEMMDVYESLEKDPDLTKDGYLGADITLPAITGTVPEGSALGGIEIPGLGTLRVGVPTTPPGAIPTSEEELAEFREWKRQRESGVEGEPPKPTEEQSEAVRDLMGDDR